MNVKNEETTEKAVTMSLIPLYFSFGLRELIRAKSLTLSKIRKSELDLITAKHDLAEKERNVVLTTDFKELGLTNEKKRNAYVAEKVSKFKKEIDVKKLEISTKKDELDIIKDLIKINELELNGDE